MKVNEKTKLIALMASLHQLVIDAPSGIDVFISYASASSISSLSLSIYKAGEDNKVRDFNKMLDDDGFCQELEKELDLMRGIYYEQEQKLEKVA